MPKRPPLPLRALALGLASILAPATAALAQSAGCAELNGYTANSVGVRVDQILTNNPLNPGEALSISGSSVTHYGTGSDGWYVSDPAAGNPGPFGSAPLSPIFTATGIPFSQNFTVPDGGMLSFGLSETGPIGTDLYDVLITCAGVQPPLPVVEEPLLIVQAPLILPTSVAQQQSIANALGRNTRNRFALVRDAARASDTLFTSSKGSGEDVSAWASISGRTYWDGYDGSSTDLTFGLDRFLGTGTLVGVMIGLNQLSFSHATGAATKADAAMIGLYAAHADQSGLVTDAYLAWSRVSYDAAGSNFDTDRFLASVAISGTIEQPGGTLRPRASLSALWEDFPPTITAVVAGYTRQVTASIGARFDWTAPITGSDLAPFVSIDIEYGHATSTFGASDSYLSPRLGTGISGTIGAGQFTAAVDIGRSGINLSDAGLDLSYTVRF